MSLSDAEFSYLMQLEKEFLENTNVLLGPHPVEWSRDIISTDKSERFVLDYWRASSFEFKKYRINNRHRQSIILARYDSQGTHTNPDGVKITGSHIHIYRDGFDDRFAFPAKNHFSSDPNDISSLFTEFLDFCHISSYPNIQGTIT